MIDVDIFSKEKYNYKQKEAKNVQNGYKTKRHGIDGKKTWRAAKKEKKKIRATISRSFQMACGYLLYGFFFFTRIVAYACLYINNIFL